LNPEIKKDEWSHEEECKVFELQKQFGNKWSEIAAHMPGRTDNSIKNCFYSAIRRNLRKFNKRKNESEKLKGSIKNLLKKPYARSILMNLNNKDKEKNLVKNIEIDNNQKNDKRPNEIICPSVSPLANLAYFSFPITPSTTPSIMSSKYAPGFFDFSERVDELNCVGALFNKDSELALDSIKSECATPHYILPQFSPSKTFQHYITPRNSFSSS
jgi:hypothetical protein